MYTNTVNWEKIEKININKYHYVQNISSDLVREDCGVGPDYRLYESWQWWISGLASTLTITLGSIGNLLSLLVLLQK